MSDEAVVRLVLVDSTEGVQRSGTQAAASGLSPQRVGSGVDPNRFYRELRSLSVDITKGLDKSLIPVVRVLEDIRDISDKDYDYSEKDYRESYSQTSLLKLIYASLSGDSGSLVREVEKGLGLKSVDAQVVSALKSIDTNIGNMRTDLTPEKTYKIPSIFDPILKILNKTTDSIDSVNKTMLLSRVAFGATAGYLLTHTEQVAPYLVPPVEAAERTPLPDISSLIGDIKKGFIDLAPALLEPSLLIPVLGGVLGLIAYALVPKKEEKEKSVNELLADISTISKDQYEQVTYSAVVLEEISAHTETIRGVSEDTMIMVNQLEQIASLVTSIHSQMSAETLPLTDEMALPDYEDAALAYANEDAALAYANYAPPPEPYLPTPPLIPPPPALPTPPLPKYNDPLRDAAAEVAATLDTLEEAGVPDTAIPPALPPELPDTELHEPGLPSMELHNPDPWLEWDQPLHGRGWNTDPHNIEEMISSGFRQPNDYRNITNSEYASYLEWRHGQQPGSLGYGPPGFALGGVARGTDTVPAMLSPGEVVVPKHMVDGGAVDHLRGKLPNFYAQGGRVAGMVSGVGNFLIGAMETDPATRIGRLGDGISALGAAVGTAVPPLGAFIEGLGAGAKAVSMFMGVINETVDRYSEYSPVVAQAQSMAEVAQVLGDMRRAQEIGPELAKFVQQQSDMQQKFEEIKVKLLMQIVPLINSLLEVMNKAMGSGEGVQYAIEALGNPLIALAEAAKKMLNLNEDAKIPDAEDPTTLLLKSNIFDTSVPGGGGSVPIR